MKIIKSDITKETVGCIVSGCNLSGANGSGLAGAIKAVYPIVYDRYMQAYNNFKQSGDVFSNLGAVDFIHIKDDLWVANAFTQKYYGYDGKRYAVPDAIFKALNTAFEFCQIHNIPLKTVKIGCDRGGLSWENEVEPMFKKLQITFPDVDVTIFEW